MSEWRIPKPHELLMGLVVVAFLLKHGHVFPPETLMGRLVECCEELGALLGLPMAAKSLPTRVQKILDARDEQIHRAMNGEANGTSKG
jgi:hypothetical protein